MLKFEEKTISKSYVYVLLLYSSVVFILRFTGSCQIPERRFLLQENQNLLCFFYGSLMSGRLFSFFKET